MRRVDIKSSQFELKLRGGVRNSNGITPSTRVDSNFIMGNFCVFDFLIGLEDAFGCVHYMISFIFLRDGVIVGKVYIPTNASSFSG